MKLIKKILLVLAITLVITKIAVLSAIFLHPKITPQDDSEVVAHELIEMTNFHRKEIGLNPLTPNIRLNQAAVNKARDILSKQYFSHTSEDGKKFSQWIKDVNYDYFYVGENLAIDFENNQEVFDAWLASPDHRANIEKSQYQEIGLAALKGKFDNHSTIVVVQLFGTRVLGATETGEGNYQPLSDLTNNYFYPQAWFQKITSLENLEKINKWNTYLLILFLGLYLVSFSPQKKTNQINIKQPIINRYQAKIFRE